MIARHRALALLSKCDGDEIWDIQTCQESGVPEAWVEELADTFESGFDSDRQTIYVDDEVTNHYHGIRDVDLAQKLGHSLGVDVARLVAVAPSRRMLVATIKQEVMEG